MLIESAIVSGISGVVGAVGGFMNKREDTKREAKQMEMDLELARLHAKEAGLARSMDERVSKLAQDHEYTMTNLEYSAKGAADIAEGFNTAVKGNTTSKGLAATVRPLIVFWGAGLITWQMFANPEQFEALFDTVQLAWLSIVSVYAGQRITK